MVKQIELKNVYEGQHLSMVQCGHWEYAKRNTKHPVVGVVAITDAGKVVLVEQFRPPIGQKLIELPAGLAGDIAGLENETLLEAAQRELLEETGYTAAQWTELGGGYSSPGLTNESIVIYLAQGLEKRGAGGGDDSEEITIHEVALSTLPHWFNEMGYPADLKLMAALYLASSSIAQTLLQQETSLPANVPGGTAK